MTGAIGAVVLRMFGALLGILLVVFIMGQMRGGGQGRYAAVGGAWIVLIDQLVKAQVADKLALNAEAELLPPLVGLLHVHNFGAAWSSFSGARWLLVGVTTLGLAVLVWLLLRIVRHPLGQWGLAFVVAGGVGNLIDRVRLGYVVDMLAFQFVSFPVFNVADIFVTCGTVLAAVYYLKFYEKNDAKNWERKTRGADPADDGK